MIWELFVGGDFVDGEMTVNRLQCFFHRDNTIAMTSCRRRQNYTLIFIRVDEAKGKFKALFVPLYDSSLRWSHHATSCTGFALSIYVELLFELFFAADKIDAFPLIHACWFTDPSFTVWK